jgi:hypothetical protein
MAEKSQIWQDTSLKGSTSWTNPKEVKCEEIQTKAQCNKALKTENNKESGKQPGKHYIFPKEGK